jgi:hypothetical protein
MHLSMKRRSFIALASGLLIPYEPKVVYSFPNPDALAYAFYEEAIRRIDLRALLIEMAVRNVRGTGVDWVPIL